MKAKPALPERVRSMEGLGVTVARGVVCKSLSNAKRRASTLGDTRASYDFASVSFLEREALRNALDQPPCIATASSGELRVAVWT